MSQLLAVYIRAPWHGVVVVYPADAIPFDVNAGVPTALSVEGAVVFSKLNWNTWENPAGEKHKKARMKNVFSVGFLFMIWCW